MNHSTVSASTASAQTFSIKKTALAGMLVALTVALSGFSIPIGASKCFPIQHLVNVLAGGSMVGAFLGAYLFQKTGRFLLAYLGEVVGTGIIGGTLCYPVAVLLMGKDVALFFYVLPFLMSTACGTAIAFLLIEFMRRIGLFSYLKRLLDPQ